MNTASAVRYNNRQQAGKKLARALKSYKGANTIVLALPRGGIVLGREVAKDLHVPLGLVLVRKIGHPHNSEFAVGAVAEDEKPIYNPGEKALLDPKWLKNTEVEARKLIEKRKKIYYGKTFHPPEISGKTVILVDDGIATGLTMIAAVLSVQHKNPEKVVVAAPVASQESLNTIRTIADEVLVLDPPETFIGAIGAHYITFDQVSDEEVRSTLREVYDDLHATTAGN